MRKRSPETEVRHLKREVKEQDKRIGALARELDERRRIGAMMSNICWNGSRAERVPEDYRSNMKACHEAWDGIKRENK